VSYPDQFEGGVGGGCRPAAARGAAERGHQEAEPARAEGSLALLPHEPHRRIPAAGESAPVRAHRPSALSSPRESVGELVRFLSERGFFSCPRGCMEFPLSMRLFHR
jgi:hypothetical protein